MVSPQPKTTLAVLAHTLPDVEVLPAWEQIEVMSVQSDSRRTAPGDVFVAIRGEQFDGHRYIEDAVRNGAVAVIGSEELQGLDVPYLRTHDSRAALPGLCAEVNGRPANKLTVIGVTGTDGKTTTSSLIHHILSSAGIRAGLVSTVSAVVGKQQFDTGLHVTTPDPPEIQRYLAQMVGAGLTHVVMEVTSHGLAQGRVEACEFDIAVVTNITHEHLDYHGSYENYFLAKARLFDMLAEGKIKSTGQQKLAVVNRDDRSYAGLKQRIQTRTISYGEQVGADLQASDVQATPIDLRFNIKTRDEIYEVVYNLAGQYNIYNVMAAFAVATTGVGLQPAQVLQAIQTFRGVPGRMEKIDLAQDFTAIVDFAHTPFALSSALESVRSLTRQRVIAVFGSAGLRDRQKRRMMAEISAQKADITIITAEDPRTESLEGILDEMMAAAKAVGGVEGETIFRVADRGDAIRLGVSLAKAGDVLIACGKGHEQSMCFGEIEYPWDDRTALRAALAERLGKTAPAMPLLPTSQPPA